MYCNKMRLRYFSIDFVPTSNFLLRFFELCVVYEYITNCAYFTGTYPIVRSLHIQLCVVYEYISNCA